MTEVVATALNVSVGGAASLTNTIIDAIKAKRMLLVLDNCEHLLLDVAELVEMILARCPDVRILATSREGLGVDGERVWPLRSLGVPGANADTAAVASTAAAQLLLDRAARSRAALHARSFERGCGRRDLSASRWHPARDRARGGAPDRRCSPRRSRRASTSGSGSSPAGSGVASNGTRRCGPRSTGRTRCSVHASARSSIGSRCLPEVSMPPVPTQLLPRSNSIDSQRSTSSTSSSRSRWWSPSRESAAIPATRSWRRCASTDWTARRGVGVGHRSTPSRRALRGCSRRRPRPSCSAATSWSGARESTQRSTTSELR